MFEQALGIGELEEMQGCVVLVATEDSTSAIVVWPFATTRQGSSVVLPTGHSVRIGEEVSLVGGYGDADSDEFRDNSALQSCRTRLGIIDVFVTSGPS